MHWDLLPICAVISHHRLVWTIVRSERSGGETKEGDIEIHLCLYFLSLPGQCSPRPRDWDHYFNKNASLTNTI